MCVTLLFTAAGHSQITVFTAVLSLDSKRIADSRLDFICCVQLSRDEKESEENNESLLFLFMKNCYAPVLLHKFVRISVVSICCSVPSIREYLE